MAVVFKTDTYAWMCFLWTGTWGEDKADDAVPPGGNHTYVWEVRARLSSKIIKASLRCERCVR